MKLEGKAKEAFQKWFVMNEQYWEVRKSMKGMLNWFSTWTPSMQFGLYQDFFDSVGLNVLITVEFDYGYIIVENRNEEIEEVKRWYNTRQEAREAAIKKANQIYNKR